MQRHADNWEGRAGVALAVDRIKDLFGPPPSLCVQNTSACGGYNAAAFLDSWVANVS